MSIRVLHALDHLGYGGAEIFVKNLVENMNKKGLVTFVCALRKNILTLPIKAELITLNYHKCNPFAFLAIAKLCKKYKIDIIHAHVQKSIVSSLLASFFCYSKVIIHAHGFLSLSVTHFVYLSLLKVLGSRASFVIANSQATKMTLYRKAGFAEESIRIVRNFIDFSRFDYKRYDRERARNRFGIAESQIVVGFVGRLDIYKGVDLLIGAASILCSKNERYRFVVVGEGPQRKRLKQQVVRLGLEKKIIFTGLCTNPAEIMRALDIAVIPSRVESFGLVAIEFMRMRIPIIASPVGGLVELVHHEKTGILLDKSSREVIAEAVNRLVRDDSLREDLIKNAEVFSRKFDGKIQLKQLEDIYKELVEAKGIPKNVSDNTTLSDT